MKNLKKVLALVLVVAMFMGLATISSAKFTDDSSVNYKEAVEVMAGIGVINGYTDNSFRPAANVTRAQMAKMVAYIIAGGEDVGDLYAGANTFTDCTSHWAKGYIAYASKTGFVAGVGNNKFNPEGNVTGTQAAKMLLCALGYDATIQKYIGTNWTVNTLADAKTAGLLKGLNKVDMSAPLSREAAAQMMFNALKAKTVKYTNKGSNIVINGVEISQGASDPEFINISDKDNTIVYETLMAKYFEDLSKETNGSNGADDFGRPSYTWYYGAKKNSDTKIGTYSSDADDSFVVADTDVLTIKKILADEDYFDLDAEDLADAIKYYVNGKTVSESEELKIGDTVEVFYNESDAEKDPNEAAYVIVSRYEFAMIDEIDTDVKKADAKDDVTCYITLKDASGSEIDTYKDTKLAGFASGSYQENVAIAIALKDNDIIGSYILTKNDGQITAAKKDDYVRMGGTKYTLSGSADDEAKGSYNLSDDTYTLYLDANGYVLGIKGEESSSKMEDLYYLVALYDESSKYGKTSYYAQVVNMEGTVSETRLTKTSYDAMKTGDNKDNKFFTFKEDKDNDNQYNAKAVAVGDTYGDYTLAKVSGTVTLASDTKSVNTGKGKVYLQKSTAFVGVENAGEDLKVVTATGSVKYKDLDDVYILFDSDASTKVATKVIIAANKLTAGASSDDVYYLSAKPDEAVKDGYNATVYGLDGKSKDVTVDKDTYEAGFYTYEEDEDGIWKLSTSDVADVLASIGTAGGTYKDEEGALEGATYSSMFDEDITLSEITKDGKTWKFEDVDASKAVVVDVHDTDDSNQYGSTVSSVSGIKSAADKNSVKSVSLDLYFDDGVTIIFITSIELK